jgi:Ca-activated chloride channel family protein
MRKVIVYLVVTLLGGSALVAQDVTFTSGVDAVTATVSVRDRRGRIVRDLVVSDFTVLDSGELVRVEDFYSGESSVSLAILLDISGSMDVGRNMDRARDVVAVAMAHLQRQTDEAALFTFDSELREVVPFTTDLDKIHRVGLEGKPWGQTSLYDAVAEAAGRVGTRVHRHRALLVITDGIDTDSRLSAPEVSGIASAIDVPVYLVTVATPLDHVGESQAVESEDLVARTGTLADLARWTGGDMRVVSQAAHIAAAVQDVLAELRHQYLISFEPGNRPGWHPLEIRTRRRGLVVRTRGGYVTAPSRPGS